jgi:ribokinase
MAGRAAVSAVSGGVAVVGSANIDHVVVVPRLPSEGETVVASRYLQAAGGKGLNQAVAAARQGSPVEFVASIGDDPGGDGLLRLLAAEGIETSGVRRPAGELTGLAMVTVAPGGVNTVVVAPLANAGLGPADVDAAGPAIDQAAVVLAQLEVPLEAVARALERGRLGGAVTMLNAAPVAGPLPDRLLDLVDVLIANQAEASHLTGVPAEQAGMRLVAQGCPTVITTLGARGALLATATGVTEVAAFTVEAMDATAAGDAFCGALAAGLAAGLPLMAALRRAAAAGALATTITGAVPSLPTRAAVDALLTATAG